jgi:SAM-dependent methyltransferase
MTFEGISLLETLACPLDHTKLCLREAGGIVCAKGHRFEVEQGVPIFAANPRREPTPGNMAAHNTKTNGESAVDPFVNDWIVNTNGNLYWSVRGKLPRYPIPEFPDMPGEGKVLVDVGCSWGRWSIAAARAGYYPIGMDVHLDALFAAKRVMTQFGLAGDFVCSGADCLPFCSKSIDVIFSYSVLQHLDRTLVKRFLADAARVLRPRGVCLIQLPNRFGFVSALQQARRGFRDGRPGTFEMRYWSTREIRRALREAGLTEPRLRTDGFLSQNPRGSDKDLLSATGKLIVSASELGRRASEIIPPLTHIADSLWVESKAPS